MSETSSSESESQPRPAEGRAAGAAFWLALAAVLGAAGWLLAGPMSAVREGRLLADTDPHYHVLRAERLAAGAEGAPWRDPQLAFPDGADIMWPPLFDLAVAAAGKLAGAHGRSELAVAAAWLPVLLALVAVALVALAGRALGGPRTGVLAAAIAAATPAVAWFSMAGRIDHHVAEIVLATAIALAFLRGLQGASAGPAVAIGGCTAVAFWTWMGSAVTLLPPAVAVAWAWLAGREELARRGARTLAAGAAVAAVALGASLALFGRPGALAHPDVHGVNLLHLCVVAGACAFAALVALLARRAGPSTTLARRALGLAAAAAAPAILLLAAVPGLASGVARNLAALTAGNTWYGDIQEFNPALLSGARPLAAELRTALLMFGLFPALAAWGWRAARRDAEDDPRRAPAVAFMGAWALVTLALALARTRFFPYFAVPCAILAAEGARALAERVARPSGRGWAPAGLALAIAAVAALPCVPQLARIHAGADHVPDAWVEAVRWLRRAPPAPDGRRTVGAPWELGHLVQYEADRPVVASPFGTEGGARALEEWAAFLFETDAARAEQVLLRHGISEVVLRNPSHELVGLRGYAPGPPPLVAYRDLWRGETVLATPSLLGLVSTRLFFLDGAGEAPLEGFRILYETASTRPSHPLQEERVKVFGLVPGAALRVTGATPGEGVEASVQVRTGAGRWFAWKTARTADRRGEAWFRVPYATGLNGESFAGPCAITAGRLHGSVDLPEEAVARGAPAALALRGAPRLPPGHASLAPSHPVPPRARGAGHEDPGRRARASW